MHCETWLSRHLSACRCIWHRYIVQLQRQKCILPGQTLWNITVHMSKPLCMSHELCMPDTKKYMGCNCQHMPKSAVVNVLGPEWHHHQPSLCMIPQAMGCCLVYSENTKVALEPQEVLKKRIILLDGSSSHSISLKHLLQNCVLWTVFVAPVVESPVSRKCTVFCPCDDFVCPSRTLTTSYLCAEAPWQADCSDLFPNALSFYDIQGQSVLTSRYWCLTCKEKKRKVLLAPFCCFWSKLCSFGPLHCSKHTRSSYCLWCQVHMTCSVSQFPTASHVLICKRIWRLARIHNVKCICHFVTWAGHGSVTMTCYVASWCCSSHNLLWITDQIA